MRDEFKPGDLSVRLAFGRVYSTGADQGKIKPSLEITDRTSGEQLTIEITGEQLTEMLAAGAAEVSADKVQGFRRLSRWGKYLKTTQRTVKTRPDDYAFKGDPATLPHVAPAIADLQSQGYDPDRPRRNNAGQWAIVGRRYDDQP